MSSEESPGEDGGSAPQADDTEAKPLQTFALHAIFLTLLLAAVPSADTLYPIFFSSVADSAMAPFAGEHAVEFEWIRIGARTDRGEVVMSGIADPTATRRSVWQVAFSVVERGYLPATLFIGLMIATPLALPKKILMTLGGLALLQFLLIAQLGALALASFQEIHPESFGSWVLPLRPVLEALFQSLLPRYVIVLAMWAVLARPDRTIDWTPLTKLAPKPN